MTPHLFILTAADGFTTCVTELGAVTKEALRTNLRAPIIVAHWELRGDGYRVLGWTHRDTFPWAAT